MTEYILHSTVFHSLALTLLHFLWQGLLIAFVLKLLLLSIAHTKPQLRYGLSALAMLSSLLLPVFTFLLIYLQEGMPLNSIVSQTTQFNTLTQQLSFFNTNRLIENLPSVISSAFPYISVLWLISVITLSIKLLIEIYNVNQLPKERSLQPKPELLMRFKLLVKKIGLTEAPLLFISLKAEVPMAIGWLKPVILLPASMLTGLNSAQLEMLILHELAHIQRHDYFVNFLQTLIEILFFFHPAIAWISKQMRNEREYCSDDIAVHHCGDPIAYAHTLTDTAALICAKHQQHQTIPVMAMTASGGDLKQRVVRLVNHHCSSNNNKSTWLAASSIILALVLILGQQLLTQPTLNLWNTQTSWQKDPTLSLSQNINNPVINALTSDEMISFSENSIAQSLLLAENKPQDINFQTIITTASPSLVVPKQIERLLITPNLTSAGVSTAELAFKRTDSTNPLFNEKNPYAEQIAQLSNEHVIKSPVDLALGFHPQTNNSSNTALLNITQPFALNDLKNERVILPIFLEAKPLTSINLVYPNMAKRKGIEIEIKVNFTIDVNGYIKNIQFIRQSKINYFKKSILTAIKKWRFSPATKNDKPIESQMSKIFSFSFKNA